eukprot:COSAG06_NODE_40208_length_404_cov_0.678689_1_plen_114_part_01
MQSAPAQAAASVYSSRRLWIKYAGRCALYCRGELHVIEFCEMLNFEAKQINCRRLFNLQLVFLLIAGCRRSPLGGVSDRSLQPWPVDIARGRPHSTGSNILVLTWINKAASDAT